MNFHLTYNNSNLYISLNLYIPYLIEMCSAVTYIAIYYNYHLFLSYFFVKKIPLSRRVGYVMGG